MAFRTSRGRYMLLMETGVKLSGDLFAELWNSLSTPEAPTEGLYGLYPLRLTRAGGKVSGFERQPVATEKEPVEVEALDGTLLCFRRRLVEEVGFMDEHFRLPYALDLDYSFAFRDKGLPVLALPNLAGLLEIPPGFARSTYGLPPEQQERQRHKNWQLFLRSWELDGEGRA